MESGAVCVTRVVHGMHSTALKRVFMLGGVVLFLRWSVYHPSCWSPLVAACAVSCEVFVGERASGLRRVCMIRFVVVS